MSTTMETTAMTVATEVVAKAARRRFSASEKLRVLREVWARRRRTATRARQVNS